MCKVLRIEDSKYVNLEEDDDAIVEILDGNSMDKARMVDVCEKGEVWVYIARTGSAHLVL